MPVSTRTSRTLHRTAPPLALGVLLVAAQAVLWGVDVKVEYDKGFNFKEARTFAWAPLGPNQVKMARTENDDPDSMRKRVEPMILEAVNGELTKRGLTQATGAPDLVVGYYLLLTTSSSAQTMGQFLPSTLEWGLPPFPAATQSLEVMNRGSLVLDFTSKTDRIIWRGVAQANIKMDADNKKREALLREGVRDLLKKFPPK